MDDTHTPSALEDLALGAIRLVREKLGFELDLTPETLPVLDHFLAMIREEGETDEGPNPSAVAIVGPCAGAYFGEVVRRSLPGFRWHCPEGDYPRWRLEAVHVFLAFNPIAVVLEALYRDSVAEFGGHYAVLPAEQEVVDRALSGAGPVREDDYYRLAVRHEVLEHTLDVLTELARQRDERRSFGPDIYAAALDLDAPPAKA